MDDFSQTDLKRQREEVRRGLVRVNAAAMAMVLISLALAASAIWGAIRATRNARAAEEANARAQEQLWNARLAQARAGRLSDVPGRKREGLNAIASAARIKPAIELRNEAIAHMGLIDVQIPGRSYELTNATGFLVDYHAKSVAVTLADGSLALHSVETGEKLFDWNEQRISGTIQFSPDDRLLLLGTPSSDLILFDVEQRKVRYKVSNWRIVDFAGGGKSLAITPRDQPGIVQFLDLEKGATQGEPLQIGKTAYDYAFDGAGSLVAVAEPNSVRIIEAASGQLLRQMGMSAEVTAMVWKNDLLAIGDKSGEIQIWNQKSGEAFALRGHKDHISNLAFAPQGDLLISVSYDGSSKIWNAWTGRALLNTTRGFGLRFSEDGARLVYRTRRSFGVWPLDRSNCYREFSFGDGSQRTVFQADFSPDGKFLAVMKDDGLRIIRFADGEVVASRKMVRGRSAYFLADGQRLATVGDRQVSIWPIEIGTNGEPTLTLGAPQIIALPKTEHVDSMGLNPERTKGVLPISYTEEALIDLSQPGVMRVLGGKSNPKLGSISADGRWTATGSFHGSGTELWDTLSGKHERTIATGNANAFFSPTGAALLVAGSQDYRFYDTSNWRLIKQIPTENAGDLPTFSAFTRDGSLIAIMRQRSIIDLLDGKSFQVLATFTAPERAIITWLAFDGAGTRLIAASAKDIVQCWDLANMRQNLTTLALDWDTPADHTAGAAGRVSSSPVAPGKDHTPVVAALGVLLVILCAVTVWLRQRKLLGSYLRIDHMMEQRNRELETAHAEILHSQKMKALGNLAAGIAHDFNNLLSVIRMSAKLIRRENPGGAEVSESIAEIEIAVLQGKRLVRSMLGYSREEAAGEDGFPLPEVVEDTVGLLSKEFLNGIILSLELDRDLPPARASRGKLEQILLNLIVNASEAMAGSGRLRIVVRRKEGPGAAPVLRPALARAYAELIVADTGPGIAAEVLPHIFEPFYTTKNAGSTRGTGLGLSMAYTMAEQEGLGISVSTFTGRGSEFCVTIPLAEPRDASPGAPANDVRHSHMAPGTAGA